jgi:hypothetical protein
MDCVEKTLGPGEDIIYRGRIHGVVYLPGLLLCLTIVGAVIGIPVLFVQWLRVRTTLRGGRVCLNTDSLSISGSSAGLMVGNPVSWPCARRA